MAVYNNGRYDKSNLDLDIDSGQGIQYGQFGQKVKDIKKKSESKCNIHR